jgi:uncharacterized protein (TIGR03435 family)
MNTGHPSQHSILFLLVSLLAIPAAFGQQPGPSFEVATIKPFDQSKHSGAIAYEQRSQTMLQTGGSVHVFIETAYGVHEEQIVGGPTWSKNQSFDIVGKTAGPANPAQMNAMLRALLEDRFKLVVHTETRGGAEYSLVAEKGGPKMKPADANSPRESGSGPTMLRGTMSTTEMASLLTTILGHPVVDHSGLTGPYQIDLKWAPDTEATGPSVFTAIQEQLGLKLEPTHGALEVLVIDRLEKPSEN